MSKEYLILLDDYIIYKDGRIYSKWFKKFLTGTDDKKGYIKAILKCVDGKKRSFRWHRVIWFAFNGEIPDGMQVNHIDENKLNNALSNLNLMTPKENVNWGTAIQRRAAKKRGVPRLDVIEQNKRLKSKPVVAVDNDNNIVMEFASTREAERQMGFCNVAVSACCRNCYMREGNRFYKGYYWYYLEDYLKMKGVA